MLETIREYAAERLDASTRPTRRATATPSTSWRSPRILRRACGRWRSGTGEVLDLLEREHDNLRAALDWLTAAGETQSVLQMAGALAEFWFANDHWVELRGRLIDALAADNQRAAARARALIGAADTFAVDADIPSSRSCAEEALTSIERSENGGVGDALWRLGATSKNRISGQRRRSTNRPSRSSATWTINTRSSTDPVIGMGLPGAWRSGARRGAVCRKPAPCTRTRQRAHRGGLACPGDDRLGDGRTREALSMARSISPSPDVPAPFRWRRPSAESRTSSPTRGEQVGYAGALLFGSAVRGDRRRRYQLGKATEPEHRGKPPRDARRRRVCRGVGAGPRADGRRGRLARARRARLTEASGSRGRIPARAARTDASAAGERR